MPREFWPPWFPVDEWFPQAAPYIELALDLFWFWMSVPILLFIAWDILARRGKFCRQSFDRYADGAARPVRGHHLISTLGVFALFVVFIVQTPLVALVGFPALLILSIALQNRHETLEYFRRRGIDPYNKKQVKEDRERLRREFQWSERPDIERGASPRH